MYPEHFYTPKDIERHCNGHFFDTVSKRFFNSRIGRYVIGTKNPYVWLFTTSEKFDDWHNDIHRKRLYTIRSYDSRTKKINTVGKSQQYETGRRAQLEAMKLARNWEFTLEEQYDLAVYMNNEYDREKERDLFFQEREKRIAEKLAEIGERKQKELNRPDYEKGIGSFYHD